MWEFMALVILRLLTLVALALMPIGMSTAPAAAASAAHAGMAMPDDGHCDGRESKEGKAPVGMHCASACTALPAEPANVAAADDLRGAPQVAALVRSFAGTVPPPAIPPPRLG